MRKDLFKGVILGAVVSTVVMMTTSVLAGTGVGGVFNLGSSNSVNATTTLTGATKLLFGGNLTDMETCYKLMTAEIARSLQLESNRFEIEPEISAKLLRAGHRIHELPVRFEPRSRANAASADVAFSIRTPSCSNWDTSASRVEKLASAWRASGP